MGRPGVGVVRVALRAGWDVERMKTFADNLGANGTKMVAGGT